MTKKNIVCDICKREFISEAQKEYWKEESEKWVDKKLRLKITGNKKLRLK